jgi:hypothetical protein
MSLKKINTRLTMRNLIVTVLLSLPAYTFADVSCPNLSTLNTGDYHKPERWWTLQPRLVNWGIGYVKIDIGGRFTPFYWSIMIDGNRPAGYDPKFFTKYRDAIINQAGSGTLAYQSRWELKCKYHNITVMTDNVSSVHTVTAVFEVAG